MAHVMRSDFASESVGLVTGRQKANLKALHDWLVDEQGMPDSELVLAVANYQQGSFGRLPNHIVLATTDRIAFTHDGGMRSIPMGQIRGDRMGLDAGLVNAEVNLVTQDGERLTFRRGASIALQQFAAAVQQSAKTSGAATSAQSRPNSGNTLWDVALDPTDSAPSSRHDDDYLSGRGDDVVRFQEPVQGATVEIIHDGDGHFAVWELSAALQEQALAVNTADRYRGVRAIGLNGPAAGLRFEASGTWRTRFVDWSELPVLERGPAEGSSDAAVFMRADFQPTLDATVVTIIGSGPGNFAVWSYGIAPQLLVNAAGAYRGTVIIAAGTQFLTLDSGGEWAIHAS